jgi:hypothetical protein
LRLPENGGYDRLTLGCFANLGDGKFDPLIDLEVCASQVAEHPYTVGKIDIADQEGLLPCARTHMDRRERVERTLTRHGLGRHGFADANGADGRAWKHLVAAGDARAAEKHGLALSIGRKCVAWKRECLGHERYCIHFECYPISDRTIDAAVDNDCLARQIPSLRRAKKRAEVANFLRVTHATNRDRVGEALELLLERDAEALGASCVHFDKAVGHDRTRGNVVDGDAVGRQVRSYCLGIR